MQQKINGIKLTIKQYKTLNQEMKKILLKTFVFVRYMRWGRQILWNGQGGMGQGIYRQFRSFHFAFQDKGIRVKLTLENNLLCLVQIEYTWAEKKTFYRRGVCSTLSGGSEAAYLFKMKILSPAYFCLSLG